METPLPPIKISLTVRIVVFIAFKSIKVESYSVCVRLSYVSLRVCTQLVLLVRDSLLIFSNIAI